LPKKVCAWDAPAWPGWTIGSSWEAWLKRQLLKKLLPWSFAGDLSAAGPDAATAAARTTAP